MDAITVFEGSDGELTKTYYAELSKRGPIGEVAMNLFRAQKCSERAKVYRGGIRGKGPDYSSDWDRVGGTRDRILNFCDRVFRCEPIETMEPAAVDPGTLPWGGMFEQKKAAEVRQLPIFDDGRPPWE